VAAAWSFCYHIVTRDCAEVASSSDELLLLLLVVLVLVLAGGRLLGRFVGRCRSPVDGDIIRHLHHADKTTPLVRHRTFIPRPQPDTISAH